MVTFGCSVRKRWNNSLKFAAWCAENRLDLNVKKCAKMSFTRRQIIQTSYTINGAEIRNVSTCRDLGVFFDASLSFVPHIDRLVASTLKTLAYVSRVCKNFKHISVIKTLYCSLIVPKIEYAALVWSPIYLNQIKKIEYVQRKFLKFLSWKADGVYPDQGCDTFELCERFELLTLAERRKITEILFVIKLLRSNIDCPQLLEMLPVKTPSLRSRHNVPFYLPLATSNFFASSPLYRSCSVINQLVKFDNGRVDIIASPMSEIIKLCHNFVKSLRT